MTGEDGSIITLTDSLPYGEVESQIDNTPAGQEKPTDYYALHERDNESNLVYMQARYYSDYTKRFNSIDPASYFAPEKFLGDPQQLNLYSYARNNPVQYNDPTGEYISEYCELGSEIYNHKFRTSKTIYDLHNNEQFTSLAMGYVGPMSVVGSGASKIISASKSITNIAVGKVGESFAGKSLGLVKNTKTFDSSLGKGIPDLIEGNLGYINSIYEVKNVANLSFTKQIKKFIEIADDQQVPLTILTRPETHVSKPLQDAVSNSGGKVVLNKSILPSLDKQTDQINSAINQLIGKTK